MANKNIISIVVPCYNEQDSITIFYEEINKVSQSFQKIYNISFEIVFVDDGSNDNTLIVIKKIASSDKRIKYVSFSRNFGKESAIYAGLQSATGDFVALMDADLQDPPSLLDEMYQKIITSDYDCVATRRNNRKGEPLIRSFFAKCFYKIINKISTTTIVDGARDFRLMTSEMVTAILKLTEYNRFSKGLFSWVGYKTFWISYENIERVAGKTKWSFWKLFKYSLEGIFAFSTAPLAMASVLGLLLCISSFIYIFYIVIKTIIWGDPVAGYPSLMSVILFIGGIQLFCLGIIGQYIAKLYLESKARPIYIIKENNCLSRENDR